MRILLVGSGGREHALAWKISRSPLVEKLWITPGNPGTALVGENLDFAADDLDGIVGFARAQGVDLVVVGPEDPLVAGLADRCADAEIPCFGPRANAAELEGSKAFCKEIMVRHRVPTAAYRVFTELNPAASYLQGGARYPLVVKASGLAAGKGVVICENAREAREAAKAMLDDGVHGKAGRTIVVEEFLDGPEASAFALTDSRTFVPLESCQDHKQLGEGDTGPNTGGMGAVSPNPMMGARTSDTVERQVILPTIHGMNHEGRRFQGVLFAGIKLTPAGPKVLEYNVRFGDPETQVLMMRMKSDLVPLLHACAVGKLDECEAPEWDTRPAITVILASGGYPAKYEKGKPIQGLQDVEQSDELQIFQAGTAMQGDQLVTNGGRVLAVTALGDSLIQARDRAYAAVEAIEFEGKTFRRDIGEAALESLRSYQ